MDGSCSDRCTYVQENASRGLKSVKNGWRCSSCVFYQSVGIIGGGVVYGPLSGEITPTLTASCTMEKMILFDPMSGLYCQHFDLLSLVTGGRKGKQVVPRIPLIRPRNADVRSSVLSR
ncbi:hypothetical protein MUK42_10518 [Musa troglodytarum]|uniref:Uncharacterized protein n=1 Tax=Musa troglodytarum TaxID=320322 RepID=A0A9E7FPI7_9LILI|nr:hypothetical protein MUK42_10518 [Musa troglodytarum]